MFSVTPPALCLLLVTSVSLFLPSAFCKPEDWQDTQGNRFRGEPTELFGPFAVFRTGRNTGRRVALQSLSRQECVRLYEALANKPPRGNTWASATGETTHELVGRVLQVDKDDLIPVDFSRRPEPEIVVVLYVSNGERDSWDVLTDASAPFLKLQHDFPGMVEGVMYGLRHSKAEHKNMATSRKVPYLVTDFYDQGSLDTLNRFLPHLYSIMVLSREGVPLFSADQPDKAAIDGLFAELRGLLDLSRPENPKSWPGRGYYWTTVQTFLHAQGHGDPILVGNPLVAHGLVQRKVFRFDAQIQVGADGTAYQVTMMPDDLLPEKMAAPIAEGLKKAVFVPAIQDGKFVEGVYLYHFQALP